MATTGLTYANLVAFPDDGLRRELLDGELIVSPSPNVRHQRLVGSLYVLLRGFVTEHGGGEIFIAPMDVLLADSTVVEPDLFLVGSAQAEIIETANIRGVPALVIEVLSDPRIDRVRKRDLYARFGVPEYWIVDPDADRVEVHRLDQTSAGYGKPQIFLPGDTLDYSPLPGLTLDIATLLAR